MLSRLWYLALNAPLQPLLRTSGAHFFERVFVSLLISAVFAFLSNLNAVAHKGLASDEDNRIKYKR